MKDIDLATEYDKATKKLVDKYPGYAYSYAQYPHQGMWSGVIGEADLKKALINLNEYKPDTQSLLYVHLPFCPKICYYCACPKLESHNYKNVEGYLDGLHGEVDLFKDFFARNLIDPKIKEIHFGGGSPTYLRNKDLDSLVDCLKGIVDFSGINEFAIEVDPRQVNKKRMEFLSSIGISRISFGVQDFNLDVQRAVNRVQPPELIEKLLVPEIRSYFNGVNFDILHGLPRQTIGSFNETISKVIELSPDRITLIKFQYDPCEYPNQKMINSGELPTALDDVIMFEQSSERLMREGYKRVGFEHFVQPTDRLYELWESGNFNWNQGGYSAGDANKIIGIGLGSSSRITDDYYFKNEGTLTGYNEKVSEGRFPVEKGWKLSEDDKIRRDVSMGIRSKLELDFCDIGEKYNINFNRYFADEVSMLGDFVDDGIIRLSEDVLKLTERGMPFVGYVSKVFDVY
ncbi:MAG: oxygen-independent coproporphyrinogen III oxidase [Nanoarchaeota archaeon]|nr:oxygen-independent coproporphyrinogen III oxidase [Nanoarchaeota archaeon]